MKFVRRITFIVILIFILTGCSSQNHSSKVERAFSELDYYEVLDYVRSNYSIDEIYSDDVIRDYCRDNYDCDEIYDEYDIAYEKKSVYGWIDPSEIRDYIVSMYDIEDVEEWFTNNSN